MDKGDKILLEILLALIIICSIILTIRILSDKRYDPQLYDEIYKEYYESFGDSIEENMEDDETDKINVGDANAENVINTENNNQSIVNNENIKNNTIQTNNNRQAISTTTSLSNKKMDRVVAHIMIPKIQIFYPVLKETTDEYLKIAPCKYWGGEPNEIGNFSIIGHNYKNTQFFSKINTLENGDRVILEAKNGSKISYKVFDKFEVSNNDFSCTEATTNGTTDLTLITCTNKNSKMHVIKCRANI